MALWCTENQHILPSLSAVSPRLPENKFIVHPLNYCSSKNASIPNQCTFCYAHENKKCLSKLFLIAHNIDANVSNQYLCQHQHNINVNLSCLYLIKSSSCFFGSNKTYPYFCLTSRLPLGSVSVILGLLLSVLFVEKQFRARLTCLRSACKHTEHVSM